MVAEADLWKGKIKPTGSKIGNFAFSANGGYEFLATEIYGYTYEQGEHYVYIPNVKGRFRLSDEAINAGYKISNINISNLAPGLAYNEKSDTIEGYASSKIQNGVYDMKIYVTIKKPYGSEVVINYDNLKFGWIGWQDTLAPITRTDSVVTEVGSEISTKVFYKDNDCFTKDENYKPIPFDMVKNENNEGYHKEIIDKDVNLSSSFYDEGKVGGKKFSFKSKNGEVVDTETGSGSRRAMWRINGINLERENTGDEIYKAKLSDFDNNLSYDSTGKVYGTINNSGIFTGAVFASDQNEREFSSSWDMYGQDSHNYMTFAVAPKVKVNNIEAYSEEISTTISKGADKVNVKLPDGSVTKLIAKNGKWTVSEGTTNSKVKVGDVVGEISKESDSVVKIPISSDSSKYAGVENIVAEVSTENVKAYLNRETVKLKDGKNGTRMTTFNPGTGKYELSNEEAFELRKNDNGTTTLIERRVYTNPAIPDDVMRGPRPKYTSDMEYILYEFERTWSVTSDKSTLLEQVEDIRRRGEVVAVGDVTRTKTIIPRIQTSQVDGQYAVVTYDSSTGKWESSDGSEVSAEKRYGGWKVTTGSGFTGFVAFREARSVSTASIQNAKPESSSTSYKRNQGDKVDLFKEKDANVVVRDLIDDKSKNEVSNTYVSLVKVKNPDGSEKVFDSAKQAEKDFIMAQRNAASKARELSLAIKESEKALSVADGKKGQIDHIDGLIKALEGTLPDLKLKTISETTRELLEKRLDRLKEDKAALLEEIKKDEALVSDKNSEVEKLRKEVLTANGEVEKKRNALKEASNKLNEDVKSYTLSQAGVYKVTVRAVDSNGVVTTPTVGSNDKGEITEDAVTETVYNIEVAVGKDGLVVNHYKEGSTEKLADSIVKNDLVIGSDYKTVSKVIDPKVEVKEFPDKTVKRTISYTLVKEPVNKNGKIISGGTVVNYYYKENIKEDITLKRDGVVANYYKEGTTEKLAPSEIQTDKVIGTDYKTIAKVIEPKITTEEFPDKTVKRTVTYTLVKEPENKNGKIKQGGTVVNYYYKENVKEEVTPKKKLTSYANSLSVVKKRLTSYANSFTIRTLKR